jgi:UDP-glucose 6-dehydrogenase
MNGYRIIVNKSTVPVGTADKVSQEISALTRFQFDVVSNPEFLKEGSAVEDFMKPDRIIIGTDDVRVAEIMKELYAPFTRKGPRFLVMDTRSAEMTKYAANAILASRISFMNEIANLCEHVGADVHWVRQGIGSDRRIGSAFLFPGVGYGGSCFPKDIKALIEVARECDYPLELIKMVEKVNQTQKYVLIDKILRFYSSDLADRLEELKVTAGNKKEPEVLAERPALASVSASVDYSYQLSLDAGKVSQTAFEKSPHMSRDTSAGGSKGGQSPINGKTFAVWGLSFKPQTDDMREAPSRVIISGLLELGAKIQVYDPEAMKEARKIFGRRIRYAKSNYESLENADALILVTEWNAFRNPDFQRMHTLLKYPVLISCPPTPLTPEPDSGFWISPLCRPFPKYCRKILM